MNKLNFNKEIKILDINNLKNYRLSNKTINLININYDPNKAFDKISNKSKMYIENSFKDFQGKIIENYNPKIF